MLCVCFESKFEAQFLLDKFNVKKTIPYHQMMIYEVEFNGKDIVLVQTGEGKVNVGFAMGVVKERYPITAIIGFGNCGYIGEKEYGLGEIAISNASFQYDVDFSANRLFRMFEVPGMNQVLFQSDQRLKQLALTACHYLEIRGHVGLFGTADRFIASSIIATHLNESYRIEFLDVESAVLGQLACEYHLPYISVKGIAHQGDDLAFETFRESFQQADLAASEVIHTMIEALTRKNIYC